MPQKGREHFNLTGFKCTNGYILTEFDPLSAIHLHVWNSSSTWVRRVNQQPYGERELEEEEELSEYSEMEYELEPEDK
jgi:hypothetical protein